jgi:hypothetical protein
MTLSDLVATLPNGLHDGELRSVQFDICKRSLTLSLNLWVGSVVEKAELERERYRKASITLHGLTHFIVDKVNTTVPISECGTIDIDGAPTSVAILPPLSQLAPIPSDVHRFYSVYVYDWNSYIHLACTEATIQWDDAHESLSH